MKKVVLARDIQHLFGRKSSFLGRADITLFTASTNDELLKIHQRERADLIITRLDQPGIKTEDLFSAIRENAELRAVSAILICTDTLAARERCSRCEANAVFTTPVDIPLLYIKSHELLNIAPRKSYRAALAVGIQGSFRDRPMPFWTENISASGMLIRSKEPLVKGDGVFFSFFLHDGRHVSGYGEISRAERPAGMADTIRYGVKFTNIDPETRAAIEAVVEKGKS